MSMTANLPIRGINLMANGACNFTVGDYVSWQFDMESDCCPGGMLGIDVPRSGVIAILWLLILGYIFMGVALGAEVFMTAIEVVTAAESKKTVTNPDGTTKVYHVRVWNATVANLTLMALGSSAPEILLSVIEVMAEGMNSGELGPSTIVGSAAFNLMIITAICIVCLPPGETRSLKQLGVFLTTSFYSVLAYLWLFIIVVIWTPEVITVTEGVLTCLLLVILIVQAYIADRYATVQYAKKYTFSAKGGVSKAEAAAALKAVNVGKDATPEQMKAALEEELCGPKSRLHYRKQAMAGVSGGANKVHPEALQSVSVEPGRAKRMDTVGFELPAADDASPGVIKWVRHTVDVMESGGAIDVEAERVGGAKGEVTVAYSTKNQKAVAGKDYKEESGVFTWKDGETGTKKITIIIYDDDEFEKDEEFTVVLADPTGGAIFPHHTDGGMDSEICTVTIVNDDDRATKLTEAIRMLRMDADSLDLAGADWKGAIADSVSTPSEGGIKAKVIHFLMVPWKLLFAIGPPPALCGGYPCFIYSLIAIGGQVVLISDFATQVGCQLYLKTVFTAITFVALGTSLPDTFASMQAARGDKYADNSIGNVTGSNSVNVFFGLGLPWLIGAIYWSSVGANDAWVGRYHPVYGTHALPQALYDEWSATGAFVVRKGDLGLSVIVFTICALLTIALLLVRRAVGRQELGGNRPFALASAAFLVCLWFLYIIMGTLAMYGFIVLDM